MGGNWERMGGLGEVWGGHGGQLGENKGGYRAVWGGCGGNLGGAWGADGGMGGPGGSPPAAVGTGTLCRLRRGDRNPAGIASPSLDGGGAAVTARCPHRPHWSPPPPGIAVTPHLSPPRSHAAPFSLPAAVSAARFTISGSGPVRSRRRRRRSVSRRSAKLARNALAT